MRIQMMDVIAQYCPELFIGGEVRPKGWKSGLRAESEGGVLG